MARHSASKNSSNADIAPTTEALFETFMQLDLDASGRVSKRELGRYLAGADLRHAFEVSFRTADTGISWGDGDGGGVVITAIEAGSPAAEHPDVVVGLRLARVNGTEAPAGAKAVRRLWRQFAVHETTVLEFYEPFLVTHDFANCLDVEVAQNAAKDTAKDSKTSFFGGLFTRRSDASTVSSSSSSCGHVVATARLALRAYAEASDVERALSEALETTAPTHFDATAVSIGDGGAVRIATTKSGAELRVLGAAGPNRFCSVHRHLGFPNRPRPGRSAQTSDAPPPLRLGFRERTHVRVFADELVAEFDYNRNDWLEFDEFKDLYGAHFADEAKLLELRERVRARFRTPEELQLLAELEEHRRRREVFRKDLEGRRDRNRAVRRAQSAAVEAQSYRDCDHQLRRAHASHIDHVDVHIKSPQILPAVSPKTVVNSAKRRRILARKRQLERRDERLRTEAERASKAEGDAAARTERNRQHHGRHLQCAGFADVFPSSGDDLGGRKERHDLCHPALVGCARATTPNYQRHPAFHGLSACPIHAPKPLGNFLGLCYLDDLRGRPRRNSWRAFFAPPICRGAVRRRNRELAAAHDRAEIVHPAFWGWAVGPPEALSPVTRGYTLDRPFLPRRLLGLVAKRPPIRRLPAGGGALDALKGIAGGFDPNAEACHVCLGGFLGCPFCFEYPHGTQPKEFAYAPNDDDQDTKSSMVLHTDLTTRTAVLHHRRRRVAFGDVLVKSMPCGDVVRLRLEVNDTVDHLHHLFRSNSVWGVNESVLFYLATQGGLVAVDVDDRASRLLDDGSKLPSRGCVPLCRYGLNRDKARAVLFHGVNHAVVDVVRAFFKTNLRLDRFPLATTRVISHVHDRPLTLPGSDVVQAQLWDLFALQVVKQSENRRLDDEACQVAERREHLDAMREALRAGLEERQRQRESHDLRRRPVADVAKLRDVLASLQSPEPPRAVDAPAPAGLRLPVPRVDSTFGLGFSVSTGTT